jgi:ferric-dicitrate binding protein FerR (iron transport regulator)
MEGTTIHKNYLGKWLNKKISDEELQRVIGKDEFIEFLKIKENLALFKSPSFDNDKLFNSLKVKNKTLNKPVLKIIPLWAYSVAAAIALLFTAYVAFFTNTTYSTKNTQHLAFNLIDGSKVQLNSKSSLSFNKRSWEKNRVVYLNGEAYFEVKQGNIFTVKTDQGDVTVLGTHFNVKNDKNYLKVTCYEGKVSVVSQNHTSIINKGQSYQLINQEEQLKNIAIDKPLWLSGIYSYVDTPLFLIFKDLEKQFDIKLNYSNIDSTQLLTVSYQVSDLNLALKTILIPLNLSFEKSGESTYIIRQ